MYNIKVINVFIFIYILCLFNNLFLINLIPVYNVPHFSICFKPINNYNWECSGLNLELLIKIYGIYLLAKINKINQKKLSFCSLITFIYSLETVLLLTSKKSSFILHPLISILFYFIFNLII